MSRPLTARVLGAAEARDRLHDCENCFRARFAFIRANEGNTGLYIVNEAEAQPVLC